MIHENSLGHKGYIDPMDFLQMIAYQKKQYLKKAKKDTLAAFIAVGGNMDGTGQVEVTKLVEILKEEFQMTINIDKLMAMLDIDGSGKIEFNEFSELLNA